MPIARLDGGIELDYRDSGVPEGPKANEVYETLVCIHGNMFNQGRKPTPNLNNTFALQDFESRSDATFSGESQFPDKLRHKYSGFCLLEGGIFFRLGWRRFEA